MLLFVVPALGNSGKQTQQTSTAPTGNSALPAPARASQPASVAPAPAQAAPTQAVPAQAAPAQTGPATQVPSSDSAFGGATYEVGIDIAPGKYKTTGPPSGGDSCYWARLNNTDGDFESIIANGNAAGPTTVTVAKTDKAFEVRGGSCT